MSTILLGQCWPLQIQPTAKAVLISLADNANDQGYCWPSLEKIAERTCFSLRAVINAIKHLEEIGIVVADRSNGRHSKYQITPSNLAKPVHEVHPCIKSTRAGNAQTHAPAAPLPMHLLHKPVHEVHTNHQEPSLEPSKNRNKVPARPSDVTAEVYADWLAHRKTKKALVSETVINQFRAEADKAGWTLQNAMIETCNRGWVGFKATFVRQDTKAESFRERDARIASEQFAAMTGQKNTSNVIDMEAGYAPRIAR